MSIHTTTKKWSEIKRPETPERRVSIEAHKHAADVAMALAALRAERRMTQVELARRLGISQGNVSELERREDANVSTLRGYVEALGGVLELVAVFPGEDPIEVYVGPRNEAIAGAVADLEPV